MGEREREKKSAFSPILHGEFVFPCGERERNTARKRNEGDAFIRRNEGDERHGERRTGVAEETLEKERRSAGVVGSRGWKRPEQTSRPSPRRWVVERSLPRLLSVSRASGLRRLFFFLPFSLLSCLSFSPGSRAQFLFLAPLPPSLSLSRSIPHSATLLFRDLVSAAAFLFFPSDLYARPLRLLSPPSLLLAPPAPLTRPRASYPLHALFRLLLRSTVPTACVSTAKSIDRNVFRSGRNDTKATEGNGVRDGGYERRFKGRPQEKDATACPSGATPLTPSGFFLGLRHHVVVCCCCYSCFPAVSSHFGVQKIRSLRQISEVCATVCAFRSTDLFRFCRV